MIKSYYHLTKPGMIYGNALTAMAGFFLASNGNINWFLFAAMLTGLSLIIGSGCAFNNYFDQDIDAKMERTKTRELVNNQIKTKHAIIFATILLLVGYLILVNFTNTTTLIVALLGFFFYLFLYTPLKRTTVHSTLIGAISGATPPVIGYTAVTRHLDITALILFLILICWQMAHFYSIAIFRLKDYTAANIPVMPVKFGIKKTYWQILGYCLTFLIACQLLTFTKVTGLTYSIITGILGLSWLGLCIKGFAILDKQKWARKMFFLSLIIITLLSSTLALEWVLH